MKSLKKIFSLNGRLDRKGYLFLGVLPTVGFILLLLFIPLLFNSVGQTLGYLMLFTFILVLLLSLISTVKRGRDSGLSSFGTLFLFFVVPLIVMILAIRMEIDIISYLAFSFVAYLLLMPSSPKELKIMGKVEYAFIMILIVFVFPLFAALVVPRVPCAGEKAKADLTCVNLAATARTLDMYKMDNGVYPSTEEGLEALVSNPNTSKYVNYSSKAYLKKFPKDAWGGKIVYVKTKDGFELISYGADRREGGEEYSTDIFYSGCGK